MRLSDSASRDHQLNRRGHVRVPRELPRAAQACATCPHSLESDWRLLEEKSKDIEGIHALDAEVIILMHRDT